MIEKGVGVWATPGGAKGSLPGDTGCQGLNPHRLCGSSLPTAQLLQPLVFERWENRFPPLGVEAEVVRKKRDGETEE